VPLSVTEFIRRWCLHIQPDQLTKTRYFGGWSGRRRTAYLARCRQFLEQAAAAAEDVLSSAIEWFPGEVSAEEKLPRCPHCKEPALRLMCESPKPSWFAVLNHLDARCPDWYAELDLEEQHRYLMDAYGVAYEDWRQETQVESAMKLVVAPPPIQLYLPGMCPTRDFLIESF
jgi:hypothetical protein